MAKRKKRSKKHVYAYVFYGFAFIIIGIFGLLGYGLFGSAICASFAFLFGKIYIVPLVLLIILGIYVLIEREFPDLLNPKVIGIILVLCGFLMMCHREYGKLYESSAILSKTFDTVTNTFKLVDGVSRSIAFKDIGGGLIGGMLLHLFILIADYKGAMIFYWSFIILGSVLFTSLSIIDLLKDGVDAFVSLLPEHTKRADKQRIKEENEEERNKLAIGKVKIKDNSQDDEDDEEEEETKVIANIDELKKNKVKISDNSVDHEVKEKPLEPVIINNVNYQLPTVDLLDVPKKQNVDNQASIEKNIKILEEVLEEFGIIGKVVAVTVGPACTQYELQLKAGTRLSKLTSINKEISLALAKKDVRIQAPIPGKSTCGIEIANDTPTTVFIREIMEKLPKDKQDKKLLVALGKDIKGEVKFCEINKTPHLLVAGATGSGKSVCINCILASILMRTKPNEVKLLLVDPKKVELSMYNGIPHLLTPVVTDPRKASAALQKIVSEMERRYNVFEENHVKNIDTYNEMIDKKNKDIPGDGKLPKMPYIVVIVDELADLMMVASKEVEDSIMRITQMARAAGIHLIIATQRPSTDVITGVIKANIPSRISFAVSSGIDSRTILDMQGAEKLLGRGDMLYLPQGENSPTRIQGAWITEEEITKLVKFVSEQQQAQYDNAFDNLDANNEDAKGGTLGDDANHESEDEYDDPLYDDIVEFVIKEGSASASKIQRRYRLGYNRAARMMDLLEERGIIGPPTGNSKPRKVLVKLSDDSQDDESDDEYL